MTAFGTLTGDGLGNDAGHAGDPGYDLPSNLMGYMWRELVGKLNVVLVPAGEPMQWLTDDHIKVSVDGRDVKVAVEGEWDEQDAIDLWGRMSAVMEARLLGLTMQTGRPIDVTWQHRLERDEKGNERWHRLEPGDPGTYPIEPFVTAPYTDLIDSDWTMALASMLYRDALLLHESEPDSAVGKAYLAAEMIVAHLRDQSTRAPDWRAAAGDLGIDPDEVMGLYYSYQLYRHVNADYARRELERLKLEPLGTYAAVRATAEILRAYGNRRVSEGPR